VSDDQQTEFRNLSEFYIIIFLSQLKIVDPPQKKEREKKKLKIRTSMAKAMGPFRGSHTPSWFSGARTDVPTSHRPCMYQ
jgi:hypothetical protein